VNEVALPSDVDVYFEPLGRDHVRLQDDIFVAHLGIKKSDARFDPHWCWQMIAQCYGLPIALATTAGTVRRLKYLRNNAANRQHEYLWHFDLSNLDLGGYNGLRRFFSVGLAALDKERLPCDMDASLSRNRSDYFASLCVMNQASPMICIEILSLLWDVSTESVTKVCESFADVALCQITDGDCVSSQQLQVHDLVLEYCIWASERSSFSSGWHERMLYGFLKCAGIVADTSAASLSRTLEFSIPVRSCRYVEAFCSDLLPLPVESYVLDHFARHVCSVENGSELALQILTDYRWLRKCPSKGACQPQPGTTII
jgi:hypothetical protein